MGIEEIAARAAIANLLATCTQAGDARKAEAYADCFTDSGVLSLDRDIAGRAEIRAWMDGALAIPQPGHRPAGFISHHLTTSRIDITSPETARGRTYWLVTSPVGLDHNGYYDDAFARVEGRWLIAHRAPRTLWIAPDSLLRGQGEG